jgi:hypothetical protein
LLGEAWKGVGKEEMEIKEVFKSMEAEACEGGVKGYKYLTPKM